MHSVIFLLHTLVSTYKETSVRWFWFSTDCCSLYLPYHCSFSHFFDLDKKVTEVKEEVRKRRQEVLLEQSPRSQSKILVWSSWLKWVTLVTNSMAIRIYLYTCHGRETVEHLWGFFSMSLFSLPDKYGILSHNILVALSSNNQHIIFEYLPKWYIMCLLCLDITCCTSSEHLWWEIVKCCRSQWPLNDSKWGLKNSSFVQNLHPYRVEIVEWKFTERMRGFFV